jgi:hypothetical protein
MAYLWIQDEMLRRAWFEGCFLIADDEADVLRMRDRCDFD